MRGVVKYLIFCSVFLAAFASRDLLAKSPPPGSGVSEVPANIILLLDTSGSMNNPISGVGDGDPADIVFQDDGQYFYMADRDHYIEKFDSQGNSVLKWGTYTNSAEDGNFDAPFAIDLDRNNNVYVSDRNNARVQVFDSDGNFIRKFSVESGEARGIAVSQNDRVYVINGQGDVEVFTTTGTKLDEWDITGAYHLALDHDEQYIYLTRFNSNRIEKFDLDGNEVAEMFTNYYLSEPFSPFGIEVDSSGEVYVSKRVYDYDDYFEPFIFRINNNLDNIIESKGNYGSGDGEYTYPGGVGYNPVNSEIYITDLYNERFQLYSTGAIIVEVKNKIETAKEVIKNIVSDSRLTEAANFGFVTWNSSADLEVEVSNTGASEIYNMIDSINAGGSTYLDNALDVAQDHYFGSNSPIISDAECQQSIIIVISDGIWHDASQAISSSENICNNNVKTYVIGFATQGDSNYQLLSDMAGSDGSECGDSSDEQVDNSEVKSPLYADNKATLLDSISKIVTETIDRQLSFTTPTIIPAIKNEDHILQSTFIYSSEHQWKGHLYKYLLNSDSEAVDEIISTEPEWDAGEVLNNTEADDRNIWTAAQGMSHSKNNFVKSNIERLRFEFDRTYQQYFSDQELETLIDFVRGKDAYNEFPDGKDIEGENIGVSGERWKLADIYHSKAIVVGTPSEFYSDESTDYTESYYRYLNGYKNFISGTSCGGECVNRKEIIYVGSNSGMLHAFNLDSGAEEWAFIPPFLINSLKGMRSDISGESDSIYGVDGSPTVKDIFIDGQWRTVLLSGVRQGGHAYFMLDITNPDNPSHMFSFEHDELANKVRYWDEDGNRTDYDVGSDIPDEYDYSDLGESWSDPLILNLKINGLRKWVGVFGGGYNNNVNPNYGSVVYIIDLEDGGKIIEKIEIPDNDAGDNITNSLPSTISAITADSTNLISNAGALLYFTDLEGSLWKINLTDQGTLYEATKLFDADSSFDNDRMSFQKVSASVLYDKSLMTFYGTANFAKISQQRDNIQNRVFAVKDENFPNFTQATELSESDLMEVTSLEQCFDSSDKGWFDNLEPNEKVTASAAVKNSSVIFTIYKPSADNICSAGSSKLLEYDLQCGSFTREVDLSVGLATEAITYKDKIYIGTSAEGGEEVLSENFYKKGNLIIGTQSSRSENKVKIENWREDF